MKRHLSRLVVLLFLLLAVGGVGLYFGAQRLLAFYQPEITRELGDALGCPVTYHHASIRLTPSLEVALHQISVSAESKGFSVSAPYAGARIRLGGLFDRHLDFEHITLRAPRITLIAGGEKTQPSPPTKSQSLPMPEPQHDTSPPNPILTGIDSIEVHDGAIYYRSPNGHEKPLLENLIIESAVRTSGTTTIVSPSRATFLVRLSGKGQKQLPCSASLGGLSYNPSLPLLQLLKAELSVGTSSMTVSGEMDLAHGVSSATVSATTIDLALIQEVLGLRKLTGSAELNATVIINDQKITVDGTTSVRDLRISPSDTDTYGSSKVSGVFHAEFASGVGGMLESKSLSVNGFSYSDPNVSLSKVDGILSDIRGTLSKDGLTVFTGQLKGTALALEAGPFSISKISSVESPLRVAIPATGGYSITGPAKANGVMMQLHGRHISDAAGEVEMLISNKELRFVTKGMQASITEQPIAIRGTLEITDTSYLARDVTAAVGGGSVVGAVEVKRGKSQEVLLDAMAERIDLSTLKSLITGVPSNAFGGRVDTFKVKATTDRDALLSQARGAGSITVSDGSLREARFDEKTVELFRSLPVVGSKLSFQSSANRDANYKLENGMLKRFSTDFTIKDGALHSEALHGTGKFLNVKGQGKMSMHGELAVEASAVYLEENLKALAGPIKPLGGLFGTIGRIEIPLSISGPLDAPRISADLSRLHYISSPSRTVGSVVRGIGEMVGANEPSK